MDIGYSLRNFITNNLIEIYCIRPFVLLIGNHDIQQILKIFCIIQVYF